MFPSFFPHGDPIHDVLVTIFTLFLSLGAKSTIALGCMLGIFLMLGVSLLGFSFVEPETSKFQINC